MPDFQRLQRRKRCLSRDKDRVSAHGIVSRARLKSPEGKMKIRSEKLAGQAPIAYEKRAVTEKIPQ
jgi:hypothetical protein